MKQNNLKQGSIGWYGKPAGDVQKGATGMETEQTMEQRLGVELEVLRRCILFRNMTDEEIRSALEAVSARRAGYARRAVIG